jgi:hypothetical protein
MLWFEQGWNDGNGWIPSGDVDCLLKSAKDWIVGVDTPGKHVHHVSSMERLAD